MRRELVRAKIAGTHPDPDFTDTVGPGAGVGRPKQTKDSPRSLAPTGTVDPTKRRAVATIQQLILDHAAQCAD